MKYVTVFLLALVLTACSMTSLPAMSLADTGTATVEPATLVEPAVFVSCEAEGFTGSRLTLCNQICVVPQTPARLTSLIRLYRTSYKTDPPCTEMLQ